MNPNLLGMGVQESWWALSVHFDPTHVIPGIEEAIKTELNQMLLGKFWRCYQSQIYVFLLNSLYPINMVGDPFINLMEFSVDVVSRKKI